MARTVQLSDTVAATSITATVTTSSGAVNGTEQVTIAAPGTQGFALTVDELTALSALITTLVGKARTAAA